MALAVRRGPGQDGGAPVGVDLDGGVLLGPARLAADAGDLHVAGQADAELNLVAVGPTLGLLPPQVLVTRRGQRLV